MPPKRKSSSTHSQSSNQSSKRTKSQTPSAPAYEHHTPPSSIQKDVERRTTTTLDENVKAIADIMYFGHRGESSVETHLDDMDVEKVLEKTIGWYRNITIEEVQQNPSILFEGLRNVEDNFTNLFSLGVSHFEASIPPATLQTYLKHCEDFSVVWAGPARDLFQGRFQDLRNVVASHLITRQTETDFHESALDLASLAPHAPFSVDDWDWIAYVPMFLNLKESLAAFNDLRRLYHEFQHKTYNQREDTKLWLLIWRSIKLMYTASCETTTVFPDSISKDESRIERDLIQDEENRQCFDIAMKEVGYFPAHNVERLTETYCGRIRDAYESHGDRNNVHRFVSNSALSLEEEAAFRACLAQHEISPKLLHLLHRATLRLASIKRNTIGGLAWRRTETNGPMSWSDGTEMSEVSSEKAHQDALEHLFSDLKGHDRKSAFDYVHYPFPETRAHEVAASEQISREMSERGIISDGARVQYVVNVPAWHTRPPASVSAWSKFRLRGPVGFTVRVLQALWRWKTSRRPGAKPRARLTARSSKMKSHSRLSPAKAQPRRVNHSQAWKSIPKLRGGGKKPAPARTDKAGSTIRTSTSPIRDHSPSYEGVCQLEKDNRLRAFKSHTRNDGKPFNNDKYIRDFLEPNGWDVDTAVAAYIESIVDRKRNTNVENMLRTNSTTPTPKQKTEPPLSFYDPDPDFSHPEERQQPRTRQIQAMKNTGARPGTFDDRHDDRSTSSSSKDSSDASEISSGFQDPSLLHPKTKNFTASTPGSNKQNRTLDPEDDSEENENDQVKPIEDFSDAVDAAIEEDVEGDETQSDMNNGDSDKENPQSALSINEMFEVFEDVIPSIEGGHLPSSASHDVFGRQSDDENAQLEPARRPLGLLRRRPLGIGGQQTDATFEVPSSDTDSQAESSDATSDEDLVGLAPQSRDAGVLRQPLQVLEERSLPSSSPATVPDAPTQQRYCHPCPHFEKQFHHYCHCYGPGDTVYDHGQNPQNNPESDDQIARRSVSPATQDIRAGVFFPRDMAVSPTPSARSPRADGTVDPFKYDRSHMYSFAAGLREAIRVLIPVFLNANDRIQPLPRNEAIHNAMRLYNTATRSFRDYFNDLPASRRDVFLVPRWNMFQAVLPQENLHVADELQRLYHEADTIRHYFRPKAEVFGRPDRATIVGSLRRFSIAFEAVRNMLYFPNELAIPEQTQAEERAAMRPYFIEGRVPTTGFFDRTNRSPPPMTISRFNLSPVHRRRGQASQPRTPSPYIDKNESGLQIKDERSSSNKQSLGSQRSRSTGVSKSPPRRVTISSSPASRRRTSPGRPQLPPQDYKTASIPTWTRGSANSHSRSSLSQPKPTLAARQLRAPIPAATYRATMYNDEMRWELEYRGIDLGVRPNLTGLGLAERLYQEDLAENLGMGNAYSYRVMTGEMNAKKRRAGWQYPDREDGEEEAEAEQEEEGEEAEAEAERDETEE